VVKIRLKRGGAPKAPHYRIVVVDSRSRRDGMPIEELGFYNPISDQLQINKEAIEKWTKTGAQPSQRVASLIRKANAAQATSAQAH
jgi:small subunit ribosomal protein S16